MDIEFKGGNSVQNKHVLQTCLKRKREKEMAIKNQRIPKTGRDQNK